MTALQLAVDKGFDLPIVYNTSGYESRETLRLLDGFVDIYLADMRYSSPQLSERYSNAPDYPFVNRAAIKEMWRQVGPLMVDEKGIARRGMIVRHLVLPEGLAGTEAVCRFLTEKVARNIAFSLMSQYTACYKARDDATLGRGVTKKEYAEARAIVEKYGFTKGWIQEWADKGTENPFLGALMESNVEFAELDS